ncbi:hypothetical protein C7S17_7082 [Burkholderia thailandensis]|nr:hypothetical protein [Burkholderia thailandensis]
MLRRCPKHPGPASRCAARQRRSRFGAAAHRLSRDAPAIDANASIDT